MSNKTVKIVGLILLALVLLATILGIVEDAKKLGYFSEADKWVKSIKGTGLLTKDGDDKIGVDNAWTSYVLFAVSPVSLLIVGYFNFMIHKNIKSGSRISIWPLVVIIVFAVIAVLAPIIELVGSSDSQYSIKNLGEIKEKSEADYKIIIDGVKPIYKANTIPALGYVGMALTIIEGVIAVPTLMSVKRINN